MRFSDTWGQKGAVTFALAVLAAGLAGIFHAVAEFQELGASMPQFIGLLLLAGILYVTGVFLAERFQLGISGLVIILAGSVLFRVELLPAKTTPSDDVYRYQWDGRVQRAGLNPYIVSPDDDGLEWLQNPEHPEPPGEETPTIYPPLAELVYRQIETVPWYKRVSTIFDLASVGALLLLLAAMKQPLHRVLAYAWNPAILISFAMSGHFDSLAIVTFLTALFFLLKNRAAPAMAAMALAFVSKFFPVLLLATFLKRLRLASAGVFVFVAAAFYVPFLGAGIHVVDGALNYARDWLNNATLFHVLFFLTGSSKAGAELLAALLLLGASLYFGEEGHPAAVVQSHPYGWRAAGFPDCLSLVFHVGDRVPMFLPQRRLAVDERNLRPGIHSCNQRRRGGTPQEFPADVVARIRPGLFVAGLLLLGRNHEKS